jgi:hypothetical protein
MAAPCSLSAPTWVSFAPIQSQLNGICLSDRLSYQSVIGKRRGLVFDACGLKRGVSAMAIGEHGRVGPFDVPSHGRSEARPGGIRHDLQRGRDPAVCSRCSNTHDERGRLRRPIPAPTQPRENREARHACRKADDE